jgi:NAD(P)-dependent dehydrogenase (short-subunit alcohol dehydrogenase family)
VETGRLAGRTCLIVGGTSGIGLASARRFLEEGARLVVTGRNAEQVHQALTSLGDPAQVRGLTADVSDPGSIESAFVAAIGLLGGRLDVLFHVAGLSGRTFGDGPLHECSLKGWNAVLDANARGTFLTNQLAVRQMLEQAPDEAGLRGTVLNTGSVLGRSPSPELFGTYAYAASKGAVLAMTLAAAARYARDRVRFNLLSPGLIDTPMAARALNHPRISAYLTTKQPLAAGPGTPLDCAEAALYLCEPASRFVTGAELTVDGGWCVSDGQIRDPEPSS